MAGFIHLCGVIFYGIFASGELQPWSEPPPDPNHIPNWKIRQMSIKGGHPPGSGSSEMNGDLQRMDSSETAGGAVGGSGPGGYYQQGGYPNQQGAGGVMEPPMQQSSNMMMGGGGGGGVVGGGNVINSNNPYYGSTDVQQTSFYDTRPEYSQPRPTDRYMHGSVHDREY